MTTCAKCGAAETERRASFILKRVESPEECINAEACALRAELRDVRAANEARETEIAAAMPRCARCGTDNAAMSRMDANIWFCVGRDADFCALRVELRDVKAERDAARRLAVESELRGVNLRGDTRALHDLRAAVLVAVAHLESGAPNTQALAVLRKAVDK